MTQILPNNFPSYASEGGVHRACTFYRLEIDLTSEHVFPAFMRGEIEVPAGGCKMCNGNFAKYEGNSRETTGRR